MNNNTSSTLRTLFPHNPGTRTRSRGWPGAVIVLAPMVALIILVCGCSSESRKIRHSKRAAYYFENEQYEECIVESMNVLRIENLNPAAIRNVALSYIRLGKYREAFPFLVKSRELMPEDYEICLTLGTLYKSTGRLSEAREEANAVLALMPTNIPALLMLVETVTSTNQIDETMARLNEQADILGNNPFFHVAVGALHLRTRDKGKALSSFLKAREVAPDSYAASISLASLYAAEGNEDMAAREYETAVNQAPGNVMTLIKWADFEARRDDLDTARKILSGVSEDAPEWILAQFHLAKIELAGRNIDKCLDFLDKALEKNKDYMDALFLKANAKLLKGEVDEAIDIYKRLLRANPRGAAVRYRLALALLAKKDVRGAITELERTISIVPGYIDAAQLLAELNLRTGNADSAISSLETLAEKAPDRTRSHLLLAASYQSKGEMEKAEEACRKALELEPEDLRPHYLLGQILLARKDTEGAKAEFLTVLKLSPAFTPALIQLVMIDLRAEKGENAIAFLNDYIQQYPKNANAIMLIGKTHFVMGDTDQAEQFLLQAIEAQPRLIGAYVTLGRIYASTGKIDDALAKLEEARKVRPDHLATLMLTGLLYQRKDSMDKAIQCYEEILNLRPGFLAAANNLAYLYSDNPKTLDRAFELARDAHEAFPDDPYVADTFGWILFLKHQYKWSISILEGNKASLSDVPEAVYHLGMVRYAMGREEAALAAFREALSGSADFKGVEKVRLYVEAAEIPLSETAAPESITRVDEILAKDPRNLAAMAKRAALLELMNRPAEALAAHESALEISQAFTPAWIGVARLNLNASGNLEKASEAAGKAKELSPDNPRVAEILGWISFLKGNHKWALGLLQESAAKLPNDPRVLYRLAMACFSQGEIDRAAQQAESALAAGTEFPEKGDAEQMVKMIERYKKSDDLKEVPPEARDILAADPEYVPALIIAASVNMNNGLKDEAEEQYKDILEQYPDLVQAKARLADIYAGDEKTREKAYTLATEARVALPDDARLALTLGIIVFDRGEYQYASSLLKECIAKQPRDATAHYYLGMCQYHLNENGKAVLSLKRALELAPGAPGAEKAKEVIAELSQPAGDTE